VDSQGRRYAISMIYDIPLSCSLQLQKPAAECNEEMRATFRMHMGATYEANQQHRNTSTRRNGWASCGDRARRRDFFVRGTKYSVLPALALDGILHVRAHIQQNYLTNSSVHFSIA